MKDNFFFRRIATWKTTPSLKLIIFFSLFIIIVLFRGFWLQSIYEVLVPEPNIKVSDAILIEGWTNDKEIQLAVDLFKKGFGKYIFTSGYKIGRFADCYKNDNYAEVTKEQIIRMGIEDDKIIPIIQPERGTYNEAVSSKLLFEEHNIKSVLIVTANWHMLRTYLTYKKIFEEKPIAFYLAPVEAETCKVNNWWRNHYGLECLFGECLKIICYWFKGYI
ncbi:MAG: YdcF family protein [Candidatus Brocadiales bacterium]|nr:YdcF family protein [Candidatus Brocadiales bacterium]